MFPMADGTSHGILEIETEDCLKYTLIVGVVHQQHKAGSGNLQRKKTSRGYFQFWIFPWPLLEHTSSFISGLTKEIASFGGQDFFEHKARRQGANKAVIMPGGHVLKASIIPQTSDMTEAEPYHDFSPAKTGIWRPYLGVFVRYWMHVRVDLCLTVEEGPGKGAVDQSTSSGREIRRWKNAKKLAHTTYRLSPAKECAVDDTVYTQAWYSQYSAYFLDVLKVRFTDFQSAIFDRKLWTREQLDSTAEGWSSTDRSLSSPDTATPVVESTS